MSAPYLVALQGFSAFERSALGSYFRLAGKRSPSYEQVDSLADCQFVIADADHAGVVQAIVLAGRVGDAVFIGARAPDNATAWMMRPIDPLHVMRELDAMVSVKKLDSASAATLPSVALTARAPVRSPPPVPMPTRRAGDSDGPAARGASSLLRLTDKLPQSSHGGRGAEALLVDDSEVALRFLETRLQRLGLHTQRATSSGRALELLAQRNFDFIFLDVELGSDSELDGLALCQHIKRQHRPLGDAASAVVVSICRNAGGCQQGAAPAPVDPFTIQRDIPPVNVPTARDGWFP